MAGPATIFLLLPCLAGCDGPGTPAELPRPADVVRIRLETHEPAPARLAVLEDRRDIERLLSLASFGRRLPNACNHPEEVIFETASGFVRASICGHCFDVRAGDGEVGNYAMSAEFYAAFQDLLARHGAPAPR